MTTVKPAYIKRKFKQKFDKGSDKRKKEKQAITGKLFTQPAIHINKKTKEFMTRSAGNYTKRSQCHEAT